MLTVLSYIDPVLADCLCILNTASAFSRRITHPAQLPRLVALFAKCPYQLLFLSDPLSRHDFASLCLACYVVVVVDIDDIVDDKGDEARKYKL